MKVLDRASDEDGYSSMGFDVITMQPAMQVQIAD